MHPEIAVLREQRGREVFDADARSAGDDDDVRVCLERLENAASKDRENLLPYLVDCCHGYATVGEMVSRLKKQWGEFREPSGL